MNKFMNYSHQLWIKACCCLLLSIGSINAFEIREPLLLERGPLRMLAEEEDCGFGLRYWSSAIARDANRAFTPNHGTKKHDVSALFFNAAPMAKGESPYTDGFTFRVPQMFENYYVSEKTSKYNPLLRTARLRFSSRYREWGGVFGAVWDMPVVKSVGRIGMRVSIPFRKVTVSKVDMEGVREGAEVQDVLSVQDSIGAISGGISTDGLLNNRLILIRMDFAEALVQSSDLNSALTFSSNGVVTAGAGNVNFGSPIAPATNVPMTTQNLAVISSPEGIVPRFDGNQIACVKVSQINSSNKSSLQDMTQLKGNEFAVFASNNNYADFAESPEKSLALRKQMQDAKAKLWLAPIVDETTGRIVSTERSGALRTLQVRAEQVTENVYEWFHDHNIDFETFTKEGFGDLDCTFFYSHIFNRALNAEVFVGFKAPTGGKIKWSNNPYKVNLGSGHWEIKAGCMGNWAPTKMFGIKAEGYYAYVTKEEESRHATFKNASVKLGPPCTADVKWDYFVGNFDLNFAHFAARGITGMLGYQVYYKRKDDVTFKSSSVPTWLEKVYSQSSRSWSVHYGTLDQQVAQANTDSIAHRLRFEASFIMTDWLEFFTGGAWTFAGRNTLSSTDIHLGFNVAF